MTKLRRSNWRWLELVLLAVLGTGCASLVPKEPPRVTLVNIVPEDIQLFEQRYKVTLRLQNPNEAALRIRGMDYEIRLNDQSFARGVKAEPVEVPAFGESVVEVEVISSLASLFQQLSTLLSRQGDVKLKYGIRGGVKLVGVPGRIPFEIEEVITLPETTDNAT